MAQQGQRNRDAERGAESSGSGNGTTRGGTSRFNRLQVHSRKVQEEAGDIMSELDGVLEELTTLAREQLRERPYATLGAALGIGYVLGGGIASGLTRLAFNQGSRLALTLAMSRLMGVSPDLERSPE